MLKPRLVDLSTTALHLPNNQSPLCICTDEPVVRGRNASILFCLETFFSWRYTFCLFLRKDCQYREATVLSFLDETFEGQLVLFGELGVERCDSWKRPTKLLWGEYNIDCIHSSGRLSIFPGVDCWRTLTLSFSKVTNGGGLERDLCVGDQFVVLPLSFDNTKMLRGS